MNLAIDFNELKASNQLPSPKGVMLNVVRLCQRDNMSLPELARQIQSDPVLAGRIIKIANVLNPIRTRQIAAVTTDVLILVGIHSVRQIALGISLVTSYQSGACKAFNYDRFWSRSVAMACAAQALAERIRIAPVAEMFTCGLLAGIGKLCLATARSEAYSALLEQFEGKTDSALALAELPLFRVTHASMTAMMMSDWSIPRLFCDAVLFHRTPELSGFDIGGRQYRITMLLNVAAGIADMCVSSDEERERMLPLIVAAAAALGLQSEQISAVLEDTSAEWCESGDVLQVKTRRLPGLSLLPVPAAPD
ncbi:HDOD domain-containing protein [Actimicrobium antarcticum]|uniref:HDOD domain-containing protein n=1 Tax=Actimicrobium antarcticum TaxID=1051899 RepID=A0ABP7TRI5_9BURK